MSIIALIIFLASWSLLLYLLLRDCSQKAEIGEFSELTLISERRFNMADLLTYTINLPTSSSPDLASKMLVISEMRVGATDAVVTDMPIDLGVDVATFEVEQDAEVTLVMRFVDDGGNAVDSDAFGFTALDTLPPVVEGVFNGLNLESEKPGA